MAPKNVKKWIKRPNVDILWNFDEMKVIYAICKSGQSGTWAEKVIGTLCLLLHIKQEI